MKLRRRVAIEIQMISGLPGQQAAISASQRARQPQHDSDVEPVIHLVIRVSRNCEEAMRCLGTPGDFVMTPISRRDGVSKLDVLKAVRAAGWD